VAGFVLDLHAIVRGLLRTRGFTIVVILTLALGMGASSAMFSILRASLLRPPPFPDADRLVVMSMTVRETGQPEQQATVGSRLFDFVRDNAKSFESMGAYTNPNFNVTGYDQPERVVGEVVSADYFRTLEVGTIAGRGFLPGEDSVPGAAPVVVLSHGLWQRRFASDPSIVGKKLSLNRVPLTVIGVMPPGFRGLSNEAELWFPRAMGGTIAFPYENFTVVARLRAGVSLPEAESEVQRLAARFMAANPPPSDEGTRVRVERIPNLTSLGEARIDPVIRNPMFILFGAVAALLLIACANTANLLLVRGKTREREMALRLAVGSSRRRLVRFLFTESLLLAVVGGAAGLVLAYWSIGALTPLLPGNGETVHTIRAFASIGDFAVPRLDLHVLAYTWGIAALTAILFGLVPAMRASGTPPVEALKGGGRAATGSRWRVFGVDAYGALTIGQVGLAVVLLAGAGLLLRSLWMLQSLPLGFDSENVTTFQIQTPSQWYSGTEATGLVGRVVESVSRIPGVEHAAASYYVPLEPGAVLDVRPTSPSTASNGAGHAVGKHEVTPDYFNAMRIPLVRGRFFTAEDRVGRPPVAIVSAAVARRVWPGEDPIGKHFFTGQESDVRPDTAVEVVGVVGDIRHFPSAFRTGPEIYLPYDQVVSWVWAMVVVRSRTPPATLMPALREAVASVDPGLPIDDVLTMQDRIGNRLADQRLNALLLAIFAGLALTIATVGVYGVVSYSSAQRSREFGIRIALGASGRDVLSLVLGRALIVIGAGLAIGVAGALVATRLLQSQLYEIGSTDPATFAVILSVLGISALVASYIPARSATKVEPLVALRSE
jgi:putative ABC transport system permease protein